MSGTGRLIHCADVCQPAGRSGPHLHFGIRDGAFDEATLCGTWLYIGYTRECPGLSHEAHRDLWHDPSDFLLAHGATRPGPAIGPDN